MCLVERGMWEWDWYEHQEHNERGRQTTTTRCPFLAQLQDMPRLTEARYSDGLGELYEGADPAEVAQKIFDQDGETPNSAGLSALFTTWGQFLDHDLSLTPEGEHEFMSDGLGHNIGRSDYAEGSGEDGPRVYQNAISWQIDANNVYGSNEGRVEDVRANEGGKLKMTDDPTSDRGLLPRANEDTLMAGDIEGDDTVFLAGDIRANENPNLLSMHTLWAREHNYWAEELAEAHPDWDDDQLFDGARQIVEFEMQQITYNEWLPHLVGNAVPSADAIAHDPEADGQVAIEFSTAAFRFGHTMVSSSLERVLENGEAVEGGHLSLMEAFFNHTPVAEGGIDGLLRGQTGQFAQELDTKVIDDLNFFLATPDGVSGFSLVALNLMRGADHGLQSYIDTREELLGDVESSAIDPQDFSIITSDEALQAELASVYDSVHQVDLWVGGLAEDKVDGSQSGPLFSHIISNQFLRTARADETFGVLDENLGADIIAQVKESSLSDVILRNTDIDTLQDDPFLVRERSLDSMDQVRGTSVDDTIELLAKSIGRGVHLLGGDDALALRGGTEVDGSVWFGRGDDVFDQSSGVIEGNLRAGRGDDDLSLSKSARIESTLHGGRGDDTVALSDVARVGGNLRTGRGDDTVRLTGKAAVEGRIITNRGDDTVFLGERTSVESIQTGRGSDTVTVHAGAGVNDVRGGERRADDDSEEDRLQVKGHARIEFDDATQSSGRVVYLGENGRETGESFTFSEFESVTCFTPGTRIVTADGKRQIETLSVGDRVLTLDAGLQPIRWIGRRVVPALGRFAPISIKAGALGNTRDLLVSPQHRMLIGSALNAFYFGSEELLAPAKALVNDSTIRRREGGMVEYIHLLFESHQIVLAEGIPSESFHPGETALDGMQQEALRELLELFPELCTDGYGPAARPAMKVQEARRMAALNPSLGCPFKRG